MPRRATADRRRRYSQRLHSLAERVRGEEPQPVLEQRGCSCGRPSYFHTHCQTCGDPSVLHNRADCAGLTNPDEVAEFLAAFRPDDSQKGPPR